MLILSVFTHLTFQMSLHLNCFSETLYSVILKKAKVRKIRREKRPKVEIPVYKSKPFPVFINLTRDF